MLPLNHILWNGTAGYKLSKSLDVHERQQTFCKQVGCPGGEMVKAMDCGIVVSEFVLQSRYYDPFPGKYPWEPY